jgi:hypothetical protein
MKFPRWLGSIGLLSAVGILAIWWQVNDKTMPGVRAILTRALPERVRLPDVASPRLQDSLSSDKNLLLLYERNQRSADPADRSIAWHAWSVCVTTVMAYAGQPDTNSRPAMSEPDESRRDLRIAAHQAIANRCQSFSGLDPHRLTQEAIQNAERHRAGDLRSRGELAIEGVQAGNTSDAMRLISEIVQRQSAYEFRDLSGIVSRWHRSQPQTTDGLRDAVLAIIGCDFGLDCSADSMVSLELCAYGGECDGDLVERTLEEYPDIDRQQLNRLRVETTSAIQHGTFDIIQFFQPTE